MRLLQTFGVLQKNTNLTVSNQQRNTKQVRCCSSKKLAGGKAPAGKCKVWGSVGGTCVHDATYDQAVAKCKKAGGRLCTSQELIDQCASGTGCEHDYDLVWSSTSQGGSAKPKPTKPPPKKPLCYKLECGEYKNSECLKKHKPYEETRGLVSTHQGTYERPGKQTI